MSEFIHWVDAGDPSAAKKHRLSLLARCGAVYVPHRQGVRSGLPACEKCEEIGGPIPRKSRKAVAEDEPHYVYRHYNAAGELLYVGCTVDPRARATSHGQGSWWIGQSASFRLTIYPNRLHALRVERHTIRTERPLWNVRHQDFGAWPVERLRLLRQLAEEMDAPESVVRRLERLEAAS